MSKDAPYMNKPYPGDAPRLPKEDIELTAPDDGLSTLRKQVNRTTAATAIAFLGSLLGLPFLLLLSGQNALIGTVVIMTLMSAVTMLSILMRILFVIRGGTLEGLGVLNFGVQIAMAMPSMMTLFWVLGRALNV